MNSKWIRVVNWGCVSFTVAGLALCSDDGRNFRAGLNGLQEVPACFNRRESSAGS